MGVELGPCGVMGLRESSHGAGRVGPKGALLQMLPWPRAKLLASPLLHGSKPCLTSCQGEERRVTEEVQPPPGSQDWDVLLTHRAGLWGPLREGSRQPPACRSGSRLQWPTLATRRHCSPNYLPQGQERGPRAPGPQTFLRLSLKTQAPSPGGLAKQVVMQSYYVSANIPALQGTQRWVRRVPALGRVLSSSGSEGVHVLDSCQPPALSALILQMGKLRLREKASTDRHQPPGGRPDPRPSYSPQSPPFVETRGGSPDTNR